MRPQPDAVGQKGSAKNVKDAGSVSPDRVNLFDTVGIRTGVITALVSIRRTVQHSL